MNNCLINELKKLKESSKESVESLDGFSEFKEYMHVKRPIEEELLNLIRNVNDSQGQQLILVCGSVGDGKSHLISYLKNKNEKLFDSFKLHNDATESNHPHKTANETLEIVLEAFNDENLNKNIETKLIIAINLGMLNNFLNSEEGKNFGKLKNYVEEKKILETKIVDSSYDSLSSFNFVNFTDYHNYTLNEKGAGHFYLKNLFNKIVESNEKNIFYRSYKKKCINCSSNELCPIKYNYEFLMQEDNKNRLLNFLVELIVKYKTNITTREMLNFIYEIIVSKELNDIDIDIKTKIKKMKNEEILNSLTRTILFENNSKNKIFEKLELLDPLRKREENIDELMIKFHTTQNIQMSLENFEEYKIDNFIRRIIDNEGETKFSIIKYLMREIKMLDFSNNLDYSEFTKNLYYFNANRIAEMKNLYIKVKKGIHHWNGETKGEDKINIFVGKRQLKYRINQTIQIKPEPIKEEVIYGELNKFLPFIKLNFRVKDKLIEIELDYFLYELLMKINRGYQLNKKDRSNFVKFENIVKKMS